MLLLESWDPVSQRESHDNARRLAANPRERHCMDPVEHLGVSVESSLFYEAALSVVSLSLTALADKAKSTEPN